MKEYIKKNKFNICIIIIYVAITFTTIMFHENWRDEAQSWLISRDLSFIDIFKQMKYEGHPCLWHMIIAPYAKLGFPYVTQNIICWIIMCITAVLILWKSPFDKLVKILILCSAPFIYYYSGIARSYCLIPLAIVLIAITYKTRKEKPIQYVLSITMLAHTHVLMLGLVGSLYLFFFFEEIILNFKTKTKDEKKNILISLLIAIMGLIILFIQLFGSTQTNATVNVNFDVDFSEIKTDLKLVFETILSIIIGVNNTGLIIVFAIISIFVLLYKLINEPKLAIILIISIMYEIFIYIFIYADLSYQKVLTILLIIILFEWLYREENKDVVNINKYILILLDLYLFIILIFNSIFGISSLIYEIKFDYSMAKETADFINNNVDENSIFVVSDIAYASAIIPYVSNQLFWNSQIDDYFTFVTWNDDVQTAMTIQRIIENVNNNFYDNENIYFIYCYDWNENAVKYFVENMNAVEIYKSDVNPICKNEKYIIYKLYNN